MSTDIMPDPRVLDLTAGIAACAGQADLHHQVAGMLAADIEARVAGLRNALAAGDLGGAAKLAHKHKGACLAVGAKGLAETFAATDQACRIGDATTANTHAGRLDPEVAAFKAAVAALA